MDTLAIFGLQFFLSLVVWGVIAKWSLGPWLEKKSSHEALYWLTLPHAFRYIGMVFPGISILSFPFTRKPMPLTLSCQSQIARASLRW